VHSQLTIHADRGSPMTAKSTALLYVDLGIAKSHSRPYTSNDNPYPESNFRTLKYRPNMPEQLGSLEHARQVVRELVGWYTTSTTTSALRCCIPSTCMMAAPRTSSLLVSSCSTRRTHVTPSASCSGDRRKKTPPAAGVDQPAADGARGSV
jgi:hypothetical protein